MQNVTIIGPNLRDQSLGQFHVHAEGCRDIARQFGYVHPAEMWTIAVDSKVEVAANVYDFEDDPASLLGEFHFAPCVKLPA